MSINSSVRSLQSQSSSRSPLRQSRSNSLANDPQEDQVEELPEEEEDSYQTEFFPDLDALRFWSHPRQSPTATERNVNMDREQGVLWKRRDVFKNRWRPRWFVLSPGQGVLTYYLLTTPVSDAVASAPLTSATSTPSGRNSIAARTAPVAPNTEPARARPPNRNRTSSWDSVVSENTVDYDVVPRGTVYLLGCSVSINHELSKPADKLFAFTIFPPDAAETLIHLSARTADARAVWVQKIARVCRQSDLPVQQRGEGDAVIASQPIPTFLPGIIETPVPTTLALRATISTDISAFEHSEAQRSEQETDHSETQRSEQENPVAQVPVVVHESNGNGTSHEWKSLGDASSLYANIPEHLVERLQKGLKRGLALCDKVPATGWKEIFNDGTGRSAYQSVDENGIMSVQSHCLLRHPPKQVFNLLIDITRRQDFETNVRHVERLQQLNPHSFLDYYAFNAFWPTSARDFAVLFHWQVVGRGDERAIVLYSFSCPEADALKPPLADHVRANLTVSMYLLRAVEHDDHYCRMTRILSFDPAGNITRHLAHVAVSQQANLPATIGMHLARNEAAVESRLKGPFTHEILIRDVIDLLPRRTIGAVKRQLTFENLESVIVTNNNNDDINHSASPFRKHVQKAQEHEPPPLEVQAIYLLAPIVLFRVVRFLGIPGAVLCFCVAVFLAVRHIVLLHFGEIVRKSTELEVIGPVTCRFSVDLKGVLRFIANKKEEREELEGGTADVSVVHIVACAVARALKKEETLRQRRVKFPSLLIDECVQPTSDSVDVSVSENAGGLVTLKGVDKRGVQSIADELADLHHITDETRELGQCLVLATPDYDQTDMEMDVAPAHPDVSVVAVVGGVRLSRNTRSSRSAGYGPPVGVPRPMLSVSLTINAAQQNDLAICRRFAEEVQKLLQFPEMCDS
jgi:hypothetical protein